ncbi:MAG TPA: penicillin-binding protein 2 [Candidatus Woesebacteria bacterium]|nr:penicillin-binding protein 2 [Candidatus Woesebacteria bacterium]
MFTNSGNVIQKRLRIVIVLVPFIGLIILLRLFYWQIIRGPELQTKASKQHETTTYLEAKRGNILDFEGNILAGTKNLYHLYVYKPQLEISDNDLVEKLIENLDKDPEATTDSDIRSYLKDRLSLDSNWVSLQHYVSPDAKDRIEKLNIVGLGFEDEFVRYYPESSMSAHILGFVGQDISGEEQGYFGLEGYGDRLLKGRGGKIRTEQDAKGNPILIGNYQFLHTIEGKPITTTISKKIQYLTENMLKEGLAKYQAQAGNVIVLETKTGKIRAMASFPNYDPGKFSEYPNTYYKNPNVADLFEPGSIFKVLIMAAGLNEKLVTPDTQCDICSGPLVIGKYAIKTWNEVYHPNSSMTDVIINSDNTGMVFVARKLGKEKFVEYLKNYGLGEKTGIQQQEEVSGSLRDAKEYGDIDLATNSFGQGIAVTPIQMIAAVNTIANGGNYIKPTVIEGETGKLRRVLTPESVSDMTQIMVQAVDRGESKWAKPQGISIAGKTGTAQIPIEGHYDPEKTIASFVGFFPANDPQYTMLVTLREPQTSPWGSETAAPLWFSIAKQLML